MPAFLTTLLASKALLASAAAAAVSGVALAAATGSLPAPAQGLAHDTLGAPAASQGDTHNADNATNATKATEAPEKADPNKVRASATPAPSFVGLCRAYGAGNKDSRGKALQSPAFTALITAAGGDQGVTAFCVRVLADASGKKPSGRPSEAGRPSDAGKPSEAGRPSRAGKPSPLPTVRPSRSARS